MKPILAMLGMILPLACCAARADETLRVMSYNIRNGRGLDKPGDMNIERIARVITNQSPDVVALQELDRRTSRSGGRDVLQELAVATGLTATYGQALAFQGGAYGVGVLSRKAPVRSYQVPLPGKEEVRTLLVCEFEAFVLFCTHLSLTPESRQASVAIINRERDKFKKPVILAGDLNARPDSGVIREIATSWKQVSAGRPTHPADKPSVTIDYIFIANAAGATAVESVVVEEPAASDHRPVFVVLKLR